MRVQPIDSAISGAERAIFGSDDVSQIRDLLDSYLSHTTEAQIDHVLFRAGRIDAVWAVQTTNGRNLAVKAYRQPVDRSARAATAAAQRTLSAAGFPCPTPVVNPVTFDTVVLGTETLLTDGAAANGRNPAICESIAEGLHRSIQILRSGPDLISLVGTAPAWTRYHHGPWPPPHDSIFDFRSTPMKYEWLDTFAATAATRLITADRSDLEVIVGHADWCSGNLRFDGDQIVAAFDWDLVADVEAVIAGLSAGGYLGDESDTNTSSPEDVGAFLAAYERQRARPFESHEREMAAAAAGWVVAYNSLCQLSLIVNNPALVATQPAVGQALEMLRTRVGDYLHLDW